MSKSLWFYCGSCGFKNHPRLNGAAALAASPLSGLKNLQKAETVTAVCEQCGEGNDHPEAKEYQP